MRIYLSFRREHEEEQRQQDSSGRRGARPATGRRAADRRAGRPGGQRLRIARPDRSGGVFPAAGRL